MTLAQLKRILQPGAIMTMTFNSWPTISKQPLLGVPRKVLKVQSNGLTLELPSKPGRGSFLDWPKASLCDITDDTLTIYEPAVRPLTESEYVIINNMPSRCKENEALVQQDLMTDGSQTYWMDKKYMTEQNAEWYWGESRGLRFSHNDGGVMHDATMKGEKSLVYTFTPNMDAKRP